MIPDLYLPRGLRGAPLQAAAFAQVPGLEQVARFGTRAQLQGGWRNWLLGFTGRSDLAGIAPACIAAAALAARPGTGRPQDSTAWIATALHLQAGIATVHLEHGGVLRLPPTEQAELAAKFTDTFGVSGCALTPLPAGEFLLETPGIIPIATAEPERCVGGAPDQLVPVAAGAAPLRRLLSEIEMWLHAQPLNEKRRGRGAPPLSALWPWGAIGRIVRPEPRASSRAALAFGRDAWLEGLSRLQGNECLELPERLEVALGAAAQASVLVAEVGGEVQMNRGGVAEAMSRLDARYVAPALQALRSGALDEISVILNDAHLQLQRASLRRFWRRAASGLTGFA